MNASSREIHNELRQLPLKERRGSRARCLILTEGTVRDVADRLNRLVSPFADINLELPCWMPRGFQEPNEAKLGEATDLLNKAQREEVTAWWLAARGRANTPNWDIAAKATIEERDGLVLVEAKAHANEIKEAGKPNNGNAENHARITAAIGEANLALNAVLPGFGLCADSHYQLCNRFAWGWKIASLGIPVLLVYLGFLNAHEMEDQGEPFKSAQDWELAMRNHARRIVPERAWTDRLEVCGTPFRAIIRSAEISLPDAHGRTPLQDGMTATPNRGDSRVEK